MEQFSLEKYLKNPSRRVVTRNGKDARIICTDRKDPSNTGYRVIALITRSDGQEFTMTYKKNGLCSDKSGNDYDLFFLPERKSVWVFLYKNSNGESEDSIVTVSCQIRERAEQRMKECGGFGLTEITWEE